MSAPKWSPPQTDSDPRFTLGLTLDVGKVLAKHGYPDLTDPASASDFVELQLALFHFVRKQSEREGQNSCPLDLTGQMGRCESRGAKSGMRCELQRGHADLHVAAVVPGPCGHSTGWTDAEAMQLCRAVYRVHTNASATCNLPKGHDGKHSTDGVLTEREGRSEHVTCRLFPRPHLKDEGHLCRAPVVGHTVAEGRSFLCVYCPEPHPSHRTPAEWGAHIRKAHPQVAEELEAQPRAKEGRSQHCPGCVADENGGEAAHTCALNQPEGRS